MWQAKEKKSSEKNHTVKKKIKTVDKIDCKQKYHKYIYIHVYIHMYMHKYIYYTYNAFIHTWIHIFGNLYEAIKCLEIHKCSK